MSDEVKAGVVEVDGATLTRTQVWALIGMGVLALLSTGVMSALLGAMADEKRLSHGGIGYAATLEALMMAFSTGIASVFFNPHRLRLVGSIATLALVVANVATMGASGEGVYVIRGLAGFAEGALLWLASSMIVRTETPARWAALLFLSLSLLQLAVSALLGAWTLPRYGADGGYLLLAVITLVGLALAALSPRALGALPGIAGETHGLPTARGWIALLATVLFTGAIAAVSVYLVPLAQDAGLSVASARLALSAGLGAQIIGSIFATLLAGRARYLPVFALVTAGYLAVWAFYTMPTTTWPFVIVTAASGVVAMFVSPFLLPLLINADTTRRAALQAPAAQLLSGGLGPFAAAWAVESGGMRLMLQISAALLVAGFVIILVIRQRDVDQGSQLR